MRDDIPTLLRDAAADPRRTPDFDAMAARARRQHVAGRFATIAVAVVVLVAGSIVLWPGGDAANRMPAVGDRPTTPAGEDEEEVAQEEAAATLPQGWHEVRVGDALLGVPGDWTVETLREATPVCPNTAERPTAYVHLAGVESERVCNAIAAHALTLEAAPLSAVPDAFLEPEDGRQWRDATTRRGLEGQQLVRDDHGTVVAYRFPTLDLWLQFADGDPVDARPDPILDTLTAVAEAGPSAMPTADGETTEASLATPRPVPDDPDPMRRAGAAGAKVECDGALHLGGWAPDFGGPGVGAAGPDGALQAFLALGLFGLPADGYERTTTQPGRVLFTYRVDGTPKVSVIVADSAAVDDDLTVDSGWGIETFATCDPAEYAATTDDDLRQTVWTDRDGERVPTSTITSFPGPGHCDWESVTFLHLDGEQYLRDPDHLLTDQTVTPYDGSAELPPDAIDTGYRNEGRQLWLASDHRIAYVVTEARVEAWPSTTTLVACA